jgi:protein required for attachment to host cells
MSESVSPKEHEAWKLCKELADEIETARVQERFDRLVLVAAPSFLGELRKTLSDPTARLVVAELDKNLAQMDTQDILQHLPAGLLR